MKSILEFLNKGKIQNNIYYDIYREKKYNAYEILLVKGKDDKLISKLYDKILWNPSPFLPEKVFNAKTKGEAPGYRIQYNTLVKSKYDRIRIISTNQNFIDNFKTHYEYFTSVTVDEIKKTLIKLNK